MQSTLAHAVSLLLSVMLKVGFTPAQPGGTSRDIQARKPHLPSPTAACRLTPATILALGSFDCCYFIYHMLEYVREGSAFRQVCSCLSLAPVQRLR